MRSLKPWMIPLIFAVILAIAATVCSIFGPNILGQMTNSAIEDYQTAVAQTGGQMPTPEQLNDALNWGRIGGLALTLIMLYAASAILNYIQGAILSVISAHYARKMRAEIIAKIAKLPISYFDQHQIGDTLSRMSNDVGTVANTLANVLTQIITSLTTVVGILIMMMTISIWLSAIALIAVPLSLIFITLIAKKSQGYFRTAQSTFGVINSNIEEDFSGQSIIKANSYEQTAIESFSKSNDKLCEMTWKANFLSALAFPITNMFTNLSYVAICVAGGRLAIDGKLLIGGVQAFLQYVSQFNRPITEVSQIASNIQQTLAASERIFNFLDEPEESPDLDPALEVNDVKGAVEFHQVNFSYDKTRPIIRDFSVKIEPGMQVAIVGPTGAGKTTIINLLMRFYDPDTGYISIDGTPTKEMKRSDVRRLFGMVLQDTWLFSGTIEENLRYGKTSATHDDIVRATKASSIHHFIESLSHGYNTVISEDSDNISAGEKQLLTIARAMVADPPMMILDEATSNVDTRTEQLIQDAFAKLTHGRTSFVIAHRLSTIRDSDLILVMRDGNIVEQGNHEQLLAENGFYAELYNSQFAEND
jgi:ATP-binding cassette subfamily B protein